MINTHWVKTDDDSHQAADSASVCFTVVGYNPAGQLVLVKPYGDNEALSINMTMHNFLSNFTLSQFNVIDVVPAGTLWDSLYIDGMRIQIIVGKWSREGMVHFKVTGGKKVAAKLGFSASESYISLNRFLKHFVPAEPAVPKKRTTRVTRVKSTT